MRISKKVPKATKLLQARLEAAELEVVALRGKIGRDFDDEVIAGHTKFLEARRREDLLNLAVRALEASDAHASHFDQCVECQASLLWCPKWYAICDDAEKQRKSLLLTLKREGFLSPTAADAAAAAILREHHQAELK